MNTIYLYSTLLLYILFSSHIISCKGALVVWVDYTYLDSPLDWSDKSKWDPLPPIDGDDVLINGTGTYTILFSSPKPLRLKSLSIGGDCPSVQTTGGPGGIDRKRETIKYSCEENLKCVQQLLLDKNTIISTSDLAVYEFGVLGLYKNATMEVTNSPAIIEGTLEGNGILKGDVFSTGTLSPWSFDSSDLATLTIEGDVRTQRGAIIMDIIMNTNETDVISAHNITIGSSILVVNDLISSKTVTGSFNIFEVSGSVQGAFGSVRLTNMTFSEHFTSNIYCGRLDPSGTGGTGTDSSSNDPGAITIPPNCPKNQEGGFAILLSPSTKCCPIGWSGTNCDIPKCPGTPECNGRGNCDSSLGSSNTPFCSCFAGWQGVDCSLADCPGDVDCSGHGSCDSSTSQPVCKCDAGWKGNDCSQGECPGSPQCSGHGSCFLDVSPPQCNCQQGYSGDNCSVVLAVNECSNNCSMHGQCNNGKCTCDSDWTLFDCSQPICNGSTSCSFKGTCNSSDNGNVCICQSGWKGSDCSLAVCKNDCSNMGVCLSTTTEPVCSCNIGQTGDDCSVADSSLVSNDNKKGGVSQGLIIGVIVAAVGVIAVGVIVVVVVRKKTSKQEENDLQLSQYEPK